MSPEYIELTSLHPPPLSPPLSPSQIAATLPRLGVDPNVAPLPRSARYMLTKIASLETHSAIDILRSALVEHKGDVNFPTSDYRLIENLLSRTPDLDLNQLSLSASDSDPRTLETASAKNTTSFGEDTESINLKSETFELDSSRPYKLHHSDNYNLDLNSDASARFSISENSDTFHNQDSLSSSSKAAPPSYLLTDDSLDPRDWLLQVKTEAALIAFHSPYPEVRAVVDPYDDPSLPVETLRVYVIALFWTLIGATINNFFVHRLPSISLSSGTVQLLLLPSGRLWEKAFRPGKTITVFGRTIDVNPGRWNHKEMMLSSIIYSCSAGTPYAVYNIFVMKLDRFYGLKWVSWCYQILFALSTQLLGFAFAFMMLKVCVYPKKSVWPTLLPILALNRALMDDEQSTSVNGWHISRYSFFFVAFGLSFVYNVFPAYLFTALSTFNWPTWFAPNSIHLSNVTGSNTGLGLNPWPTFDWNIFDMFGCLSMPFYTYANQYLGMLGAFCTIILVYYTNNKWTAYFPINSNRLFNNKGKVYDVKQILNDKSGFDEQKYLKYGPPYFSAANLVIYGAYFCLYPFAILYHAVTEWDSLSSSFVNIWHTFREIFHPHSTIGIDRFENDPHCKMMSKYEEVPSVWFLAILVVSIVFAVSCVWFYPVETPVWGIFFTVGINFLFLIPITAMASVTGFTFGLNVLVELIVGYAIPNSGLALITLKAYGYNIDSQASNYITDQKIAHYTKIPPRAIFRGQVISTLMSVFVALFIANWQIANIPDICENGQKNRLSCPGANTFFFSSIQYGEIGPQKVFSGLYPVLKWCFLLGALLVIPCALFKRHGPPRFAKYFHPTIMMGGFLSYAPFNLSYFTGGLYLSYIFMYRIKRDYILWWEKYNYILSSALSAGVAFSALFLFFTVQYNGQELNWWGNRISHMGIEGSATRPSWLQAKDAPGGYVGLREGHFP